MPEYEGRQTPGRIAARRDSAYSRGLHRNDGPDRRYIRDERGQTALLREGGARRRARSFRFGTAWNCSCRRSDQDAPAESVQAEPSAPTRGERAARPARAGERRAIVAPQAERQAVLGNGTREAAPRRRVRRARQGIDAQHIATGPIAERQGITPPRVARTEFAFVIHRPAIIGRPRHTQPRSE